ncbi:MAG: hypothetical protein Q7K33_04245 [Candidatus Berkelbacteria bacterium]|nr:hypothetical protein [Candidatus Berkelbacteria bacterium]
MALTPRQEEYLKSLPRNVARASVKIFEWNEHSLEVARLVIESIKAADRQLNVYLRGSVPLKIAGQKDIDLTSVDSATKFQIHISRLKSVLGKPEKINSSSVVWHFRRSGYEVSFYIVDSAQSDQLLRQDRIHHLLLNNPSLLEDYQRLKISMDGQPYHSYQKAKFEFFTHLLSK